MRMFHQQPISQSLLAVGQPPCNPCYHVPDDGALANWENVESTIHTVTFWEGAYKASWGAGLSYVLHTQAVV
eukprot:251946-Pelagomonas_calceolata.AAC.1